MKSRCILSVILSTFVVSHASAAYEDVVLADNPVAYWRLDEQDDSSGPSDVGELIAEPVGWDDQGGLTFGEPGIPGSDGSSVLFQIDGFSFACNGACGAGNVMLDDDFVDEVLDLGVIGDDTPITMEAWFTLREGWESSSYPRIF